MSLERRYTAEEVEALFMERTDDFYDLLQEKIAPLIGPGRERLWELATTARDPRSDPELIAWWAKWNSLLGDRVVDAFFEAIFDRPLVSVLDLPQPKEGPPG